MKPCPHCSAPVLMTEGDVYECDCGASWSGFEYRRPTIMERMREEVRQWDRGFVEHFELPVQWLPEPISVVSWEEF